MSFSYHVSNLCGVNKNIGSLSRFQSMRNFPVFYVSFGSLQPILALSPLGISITLDAFV